METAKKVNTIPYSLVLSQFHERETNRMSDVLFDIRARCLQASTTRAGCIFSAAFSNSRPSPILQPRNSTKATFICPRSAIWWLKSARGPRSPLYGTAADLLPYRSASVLFVRSSGRRGPHANFYAVPIKGRETLRRRRISRGSDRLCRDG